MLGGSLDLRTREDSPCEARKNMSTKITFMSICPEYQGQGFGSTLMQQICEEMDRHDMNEDGGVSSRSTQTMRMTWI